MRKYILTILIALFLPAAVFAAQLPLVPCGEKGNPCQLCHFFVMLDRILDFVLFHLVPPIAVIMLVIGGITFFLAGGNPQAVGRARGILTAAVIGLVIIYGAWLLVNAFFMLIGVSEWTGLQNWFEYPCP